MEYVEKFVQEEKRKVLGIYEYELSPEELAKAERWVKMEPTVVGYYIGFSVVFPGRPDMVTFLSKNDKIYQISVRGGDDCLYTHSQGRFEYGEAPHLWDIFSQLPFTLRLY